MEYFSLGIRRKLRFAFHPKARPSDASPFPDGPRIWIYWGDIFTPVCITSASSCKTVARAARSRRRTCGDWKPTRIAPNLFLPDVRVVVSLQPTAALTSVPGRGRNRCGTLLVRPFPRPLTENFIEISMSKAGTAWSRSSEVSAQPIRTGRWVRAISEKTTELFSIGYKPSSRSTWCAADGMSFAGATGTHPAAPANADKI